METKASKRKKQNLQEEEGNRSDRIHTRSLDDLPEDIIKHILTFLPTVHAVRTSLLSRKWRKQKLWRSLPILHFKLSHFLADPGFIPNDYTPFVEFVDETLKRRSSIPILKFHLQVEGIEYDLMSKLDEWVSYAISHKATYLGIKIYVYHFNFDLIENSHVRDLSLTGCDIYYNYMSYYNLDSIRSVCLDDINFRLSKYEVGELISWCKNLESLVLKSCHGTDRFKICSSTLKKLSLENAEGSFVLVEICCPNLRSLCISDFMVKKLCIKDSLVEAKAELFLGYDYLSRELEWWSKVIREITTVKQLTTENYLFELLCKNDASLDGCVFENLNHLELVTACGHCDLVGIAALLKICPNITMLTLDISWSNCDYNVLVPRKLVDKPLEFDIPKLKVLILKNSKDKKIDVLVEMMKKHGAALEKIVVLEPNGKRSSIPL